MGFLNGKRLLITGVLSNRSIAYGIAHACRAQGAELAFTYVGERFEGRVRGFAEELGSNIVIPCDVSDDAQIEATFTALREHWDGLDGLVHSIGFAPREALEGDFLDEEAMVRPRHQNSVGDAARHVAAGADLRRPQRLEKLAEEGGGGRFGVAAGYADDHQAVPLETAAPARGPAQAHRLLQLEDGLGQPSRDQAHASSRFRWRFGRQQSPIAKRQSRDGHGGLRAMKRRTTFTL